MKRKRKIRWSASVGAQQSSGLFGTEGSFLGELSLFLLCTLLLFGAACGMLQSVFGWEALTGGLLLRLAVVTFLVIVAVEATWRWKPFIGKLVRGGIGIVGLLGFFVYLWKTESGQMLIDGFSAMAGEYLEYWNAYFDMSLRYAGGDGDEIVAALEFGLTLLCFLFVWWARISKRSWVPVLVPGFVLLAELLVGEAPEGVSLLVAAVGVFSINAAGYRRPEFAAAPDKYNTARRNGGLRAFFWIFVCAGILVLCAGVSIAGKESAADAVDDGKHRLERKNKEMMQEIADWTGWQEVNVAKSVERAVEEFLHKKDIKTKNSIESNFARLDNETPEYEEVTVLKLAMDKKPECGVYLIGFYADRYKDGVWDTDVEAFEKACQKAGYDPETISKAILSLAPDKAAAYYGKEKLSDFSHRGIGGTVQYAKGNLVKTYLPYFAEVTDEKVRAEGDARYVKEKSATRVSFTLWNYNVDDLIAVLFRGEKTEDAWEKEPWELWYEEYVKDNYLDVPKGMTRVKEVAEEIRNWNRDFFSIEGKESVNFDRLNKAYQVADWMRENTVYRLELPELPRGSDPVEYFLGTSKQGYCMHYASASVMILRELGVPARYVSGYVATNYWQDGTTMKFESVVKDSAAHAWVEIYLEGFGWVPVEVTNGYSVIPAGEQTYRQTETGGYKLVRENWPEYDHRYPGQTYWGATQPFYTPHATATPKPTATPEPGENVTDREDTEEGGESREDSTVEPEEPGEKSPEEKQEEEQVPEDNENASKDYGGVLFAVLGGAALLCLLVALLSACGVFRKIGCGAEERKLLKRRGFGGNRQRIKLWNRLLYRKLYAKGRLKKYVWDEEYEAVLKKNGEMLLPEELERYMYLVKAAAFSKQEFTDEEAEFCKRVYQRLVYPSKYEKAVTEQQENQNR